MEGMRSLKRVEKIGDNSKKEAASPKGDDVVDMPSLWRIPDISKRDDSAETPGVIRIPKEDIPTDIDPAAIDSWIRDQERRREEEKQRRQPEIPSTPPMPEYPPQKPEENPGKNSPRGVEIIQIVKGETRE